jgi:hypothetical protein
VLYQLLSGRPPFFSAMPGALLMMQVMDRPTPLNAVRPDLPPGLSELVGDLMEKEPGARPATAAQVISRIEAVQSTLGPEAPEYEADRETIRASDHRGAMSDTRLDQAWSQSGRPTVLTPERMQGPTRPGGAAPPPWEPVGQPMGAPAQPPAPFPVPAQPGPAAGSVPQAAPARANAVPEWPAVRPAPRSRPVWRGVVSTLITAAIVAGVGVYLWEREHQTLKITGVDVTAAKQSVGCNGTADIIGTITTNGHGGRITYQWVHGTTTDPTLVANDASGSDTVQVRLQWAFHGKGTGRAVAELRVLTPQSDEGSITFPYSCPK